MTSYSFGSVTPSSGAAFYFTGIAPGPNGGCPVLERPTTGASFARLTDTTQGGSFSCANRQFDELSPIASGSGPAIVCDDESFVRSHDSCYGLVIWSPSRFIVDPFTSSVELSLPSTCVQDPQSSEFSPEYICEGNSIVRAVSSSSGCRWQGTNLICSNCTPRFAPAECPSILGPDPDTVVTAPTPTPPAPPNNNNNNNPPTMPTTNGSGSGNGGGGTSTGLNSGTTSSTLKKKTTMGAVVLLITTLMATLAAV